jgi:membrane associated rhomboid family serine protease
MAWQDRAYNSENMPSGPRLVFPMPSWLTLGLIVACLVVFILQAVTSSIAAIASPIVRWGGLEFAQYHAFTQPWRWLTYQYIHGNGRHIFWNLITLYFFVPMLERYWGWKRTLIFYTLGGIAAGITGALLGLLIGHPLFLIGASGSIFAVMGAVTAIAPDMQVLAMLLIPLTMRTMTILFTILYALTVIGDRDMADAAHLGGLAFGFFAIRVGPRIFGDRWPFGAQPAHEYEELAGTGGSSGFGANLYEPTPTLRRRHRHVSRRAIKKARKLAEQAALEQQRIDMILAKVSATGMASLTWRERRALHKATERQRKRDLELSRER